MSIPETGQVNREDALDEILGDYLRAVQEGSAPSRQELLERHPELAPELAAFFADRDRFDHLAAPLRQVVAPGPPPEGETALDNYELLEEIGRGGMGVIYRARQRNPERIVALKMLRLGPWATSAELQRFRTEADAVANLDHSHIVPIYEVGEHQGQPYFTMRLMEGGSLAQALRGGPLPGDGRKAQHRAARLVATVARAVHYAHQRGILHRDLKPANILLDAEGEPHVTDFGLAKRVAEWERAEAAGANVAPPEGNSPSANGTPQSAVATPRSPGARRSTLPRSHPLTQTGSILGTPSYMAPEQASGRKGLVTTAADVYSLGAVLYELLTGRPPFRADTPLETLRQLLEEEPERPRALRADIEADLETICLKCLEKDPRQRYPGALALAEDLERFLAGKPIHARPVGPLERAWRWCRRQPAQAAALGLGLLTLLTLVVGSFVFAVAEARHADRLNQAAQELAAEKAQTEAALEEARRQTREAERQRERADASFRQAHQAVNQFCLRVSQELNDVPGLQPLRKQLLESALRYYQTFLRERDQDPKLREELAEAHWEAGKINGVLGFAGKTRAAYEKALAIYQDLLRAEPNNVHFQRQVAALHHDLGMYQETTEKSLALFLQARDLCQRFLRDHPADLNLQKGLANNYNSMAIDYRRLGDLEKSIACFEKARDAMAELVERNPSVAELQGLLALYVNNLGVFQSDLGRHDQALQSFTKARDLRRKLVRANPKSGDEQLALAASYRDLGMVYKNTGRRSEALESFRAALDIRQTLANGSPSVVKYQRDLAGIYRDMGALQQDDGHPADALASLKQARAVDEKLLKLNRASSTAHNALALTDYLIGGVYEDLKDPAAARKAYQQARGVQEKLVSAHSDNLDFQHNLARTLNNLGLLLHASGKTEEALAIFQQGIDHQRRAFERGPQVVQFRKTLGKLYANVALAERGAGRPGPAVTATLERQKLWKGNPAELYNTAGDLARAAALVGKGKTALSDAEEAERRRYGDLVLEALRQAADAGFQDGRRLADAVFDPVRDRADFQELVNRLKR